MIPVLQACLNGMRPPDAHPCLPITPHQLARDARAAAALGIPAVHIHPPGGHGHDTPEAHHIADTVAAIHTAAPALHVTVPATHAHTVTAWAHLGPATPDAVAVTVSDPGWRQTCTAAHTHGIGVELCIHTAADAIHLHHTGLPPGVLRITAEVTIADPTTALAEADHILKALATLDLPLGLHGQDTAAWPIWHYATHTGLHTRIGLEDTLTRPDGTPTTGNPDLIHHAQQLTPPQNRPDRTGPTRPLRSRHDRPHQGQSLPALGAIGRNLIGL